MADNVDPTDPDADIKHLPAYARDIAKAIAAVIDLVERGKVDLVADQDFERAAALNDLEKRLKKYHANFVYLWPKDSVKEP